MSTATRWHDEATLGKAYDARLVRRFLPFARPGHRAFLGALVLLLPLSGFSVAQALVLAHAVDRRFAADVMLVVAIVYGVLLLLEGLARYGHVYLLALGGQRCTSLLRSRVFRHLQALQLQYFDRTPVGRLLTRATNDVDNVSEAFVNGLTAVGDLVSLVVIFVTMVALDPELALTMVAVLPPLAVVVEAFRRRAREAFREIRSKTARINATLSEQVQGVALIQAFSREDRCAAEFDELNAGFLDANKRAIRYDVGIYAFVDAFGDVVVAALLLSAAWSLSDDPPSAGVMVAFLELVRRFFNPIRELSNKYTVLQSAMASLERIFELLDVTEVEARSERGGGGAQADGPGEPVIRFDRVGFRYTRGEPVLCDVSMTVRRGEKVAIVGATGAGKTTVLQLVLRLYEAQEGRVVVLGVDVRDRDLAELRRLFAVVGQDVFLFAGDVMRNVAFGDAVPDRARVEWALEQVGALERLRPRGGVDARVDERGSNFSQGERQLLAFARALYRDRQILILDEATASVDSETEALFQAAVERTLQGRTALIVAHRLSTIRSADRIVVLLKGRVVEEGSHAELLARGGAYARLHALHFGAEEDELSS